MSSSNNPSPASPEMTGGGVTAAASSMERDKSVVNQCNDKDNDKDKDNNRSSSSSSSSNMAMDQNVEVTTSNSLILSPVLEEAKVVQVQVKATSASDLSKVPRTIWVVTTAALPWRTGTAVNPLVRALNLVRHSHNVTLLIPWLPNKKEREQLYGQQQAFETEKEQEEYIRDYCRNRCNAHEEEPKLQIQFWNGTYGQTFGSIFPTEDICALVPHELADVAILEEPEHLNWFRVPGNSENKQDKLGWAFKFTHVVGILHTNYAAYMKQYGIGGSAFVTARALNALSALVITAYCHRVIKLSPTLPSLLAPDISKDVEVTSNVHGVRDEFLQTTVETHTYDRNDDLSQELSPVYFIGKIIWAKGFDLMLKVQELYQRTTGDYFKIDVYGGGDDLAPIQRAFLGRRGGTNSAATQPMEKDNDNDGDARASAVLGNTTESLRQQLTASVGEHDKDDSKSPESSEHGSMSSDNNSNNNNATTLPPPLPAVDVLGQLTEKVVQSGAETADASLKLVEAVLQHGIGVITGGSKNKTGSTDLENKTTSGNVVALDDDNEDDDDEDAAAAKALTLVPPVSPIKKVPSASALDHFLPSKARWKWRKQPIPARFMGPKDHIEIRDLHSQKIFLNMSTTEVLCTTSAEALAMGKFVILPKHPSNEFFLQFDNCLAYETLEQCVEQLQFALQNDPKILSEEHRQTLSWEGATLRLYEASSIMSNSKTDHTEARRKAAKTHVDMAKKSHFVTSLFSGKALMKKLSSSSTSPMPSQTVAVAADDENDKNKDVREAQPDVAAETNKESIQTRDDGIDG